MTNIIEKVFAFNQDAGLLDKPYDDFLESSFQIEEALEGFDLDKLVRTYDLDSEAEAKSISRSLIEICVTKLSDVDRADKHIDSLIYDLGALAKLRLNPEQIERMIMVVVEANKTKLACKKDKYGKLGKPTDFVGPETELQKILDERN